MDTSKSTMAQQVAQAALTFQQQRTGHVAESVTVVLSEGTLVITLHEALSPTEKDLAKSPAGATQVQEFHRQLFSASSQRLRMEIEKITGVEWREAIAEVEPTTGDMVQAFTRSAVLQIFCLAQNKPEDSRSGRTPGESLSEGK